MSKKRIQSSSIEARPLTEDEELNYYKSIYGDQLNDINTLISKNRNTLENTKESYDPFSSKGFGFEGESKYDINATSPDVDINQLRYDSQGALEAWGNNLASFTGKTTTQTIGGLLGVGYGIGSAIANRDFSKLYDNEVINKMNEAGESIENAFPTYAPTGYDKLNFGQKLLASPVKFGDDALDALSFTASMIATDYLTMGAAKAAKLTALPKLLQTTLGSSKVLTAANKADDLLTATGKLGVIEKGANAVGQTARLLNASFFEAAVEANHTKKATVQELIEIKKKQKLAELKQTYGENYNPKPEELILTDDDEAEIEQFANSAGTMDFMGNLAILSLSNATQFQGIFGFKKPPKVPKRVKFEDVGDDITAKVVKPSKLGRRALLAKDLLKGPLIEGFFEEGLQGVVSEASKEYIKAHYNAEAYSEVFNYLDSFADAFGNAFADQYTSKEGLSEIGFGVLVGGISSVIQGDFKQTSRELKDAEQFVKNFKNINKDTLRKVVATYVSKGLSNSPSEDKLFHEMRTRSKSGLSDYTKKELNEYSKLPDIEFAKLFDLTVDEAKIAKETYIPQAIDTLNLIEKYEPIVSSLTDIDKPNGLAKDVLLHSIVTSKLLAKKENTALEVISKKLSNEILANKPTADNGIINNLLELFDSIVLGDNKNKSNSAKRILNKGFSIRIFDEEDFAKTLKEAGIDAAISKSLAHEISELYAIKKEKQDRFDYFNNLVENKENYDKLVSTLEEADNLIKKYADKYSNKKTLEKYYNDYQSYLNGEKPILTEKEELIAEAKEPLRQESQIQESQTQQFPTQPQVKKQSSNTKKTSSEPTLELPSEFIQPTFSPPTNVTPVSTQPTTQPPTSSIPETPRKQLDKLKKDLGKAIKNKDQKKQDEIISLLIDLNTSINNGIQDDVNEMFYLSFDDDLIDMINYYFDTRVLEYADTFNYTSLDIKEDLYEPGSGKIKQDANSYPINKRFMHLLDRSVKIGDKITIGLQQVQEGWNDTGKNLTVDTFPFAYYHEKSGKRTGTFRPLLDSLQVLNLKGENVFIRENIIAFKNSIYDLLDQGLHEQAKDMLKDYVKEVFFDDNGELKQQYLKNLAHIQENLSSKEEEVVNREITRLAEELFNVANNRFQVFKVLFPEANSRTGKTYFEMNQRIIKSKDFLPVLSIETITKAKLRVVSASQAKPLNNPLTTIKTSDRDNTGLPDKNKRIGVVVSKNNDQVVIKYITPDNNYQELKISTVAHNHLSFVSPGQMVVGLPSFENPDDLYWTNNIFSPTIDSVNIDPDYKRTVEQVIRDYLNNESTNSPLSPIYRQFLSNGKVNWVDVFRLYLGPTVERGTNHRMNSNYFVLYTNTDGNNELSIVGEKGVEVVPVNKTNARTSDKNFMDTYLKGVSLGLVYRATDKTSLTMKQVSLVLVNGEVQNFSFLDFLDRKLMTNIVGTTPLDTNGNYLHFVHPTYKTSKIDISQPETIKTKTKEVDIATNNKDAADKAKAIKDNCNVNLTKKVIKKINDNDLL